MPFFFLTLSFILFERRIIFPKDEVALDVFEKKKNKRKREKRSQHWSCSCFHSAIHPSELKITYILFPLFLENCHGHRGGRVASCALKCLKPSQSALHCLSLSKWNTLNTHSKVWKHEIGTMVSYCSTAHIFALPSASLVCPFHSLSLDSYSSSNICLNSCGSLGERTGTFLGSLCLEEYWEGKTAFKFPKNVVLDKGWNRSEKGGTYT